MPIVTVRIPGNNRTARIMGWIIAHKKKKAGNDAATKRKQVIVDVDTAVQDPLTNYWVLSLEKGAGQRIRRNFLYVVAFDRRGRMIDRMIRRLR